MRNSGFTSCKNLDSSRRENGFETSIPWRLVFSKGCGAFRFRPWTAAGVARGCAAALQPSIVPADRCLIHQASGPSTLLEAGPASHPRCLNLYHPTVYVHIALKIHSLAHLSLLSPLQHLEVLRRDGFESRSIQKAHLQLSDLASSLRDRKTSSNKASAQLLNSQPL